MFSWSEAKLSSHLR